MNVGVLSTCVAVLAMSVAAQSPVHLAWCGRADGAAVLQQALALPNGVDLDLRVWDEASLLQSLTGDLAAAPDVVFGLDAVHCDHIASAFEAMPAGPASDVPPRYRDPQGRFVVPFVSPWGVVPQTALEEELESWDRLISGNRVRGPFAVAEPWGAPSLWLGWIDHLTDDGWSTPRILAWLRALDRFVDAYALSLRACRDAVFDGEAAVGFLPRDLALESVLLPQHGTPARGLGVAVVRGRARPAVVRVRDGLVSRDFAPALDGLLPVPRLDGEGREGRAAAPDVPLWRYDHDAARLDEWVALWQREVRGEGRSERQIEGWLDLAFAVVFVVFVIVVYRKLGAAEKAPSDAPRPRL